jgi:hypothetical protein
MYRCPDCGDELMITGGYDRGGADYGGAALDVTQYACRTCQRDYLRTVQVNFEGCEIKEWKPLAEYQWPRSSHAAGDRA